jgi:hypothetical protein
MSPLAEAILAWPMRNPHDDARKAPHRLGLSVWAYEMYDGHPTPAESKAAVAELAAYANREAA